MNHILEKSCVETTDLNPPTVLVKDWLLSYALLFVF